jgi:putative oxidoreductase
MALTRLIARPLLASVFVTSGIDTLRDPESRVKLADPVTSKIADTVPPVPDDTELLVKVNAAVQVGAGAMLAIGKLPRLSAALLAGSLVPTTLAGHRFWEEVDETKRKQQQVHFFKNLSLLGALVIAAFDTEGAPSVTWRAKQAVHHTAERAESARASLSHS